MSANRLFSRVFQGVIRSFEGSAKFLPLAAAAAFSIGLASSAAASTACNAAWSSTMNYEKGDQVSETGINYTAAFDTGGQNPASNNGAQGSGQPWNGAGPCGPTAPKITPMFAPYIDMGTTYGEAVVTEAQNAGLKAITLAFLNGYASGYKAGTCGVGWGGYLPQVLNDDTLWNGTTVQALVASLQKNGVQVIISFGGQSNPGPAYTCAHNGASAATLEALYQSVITRYHVNYLDFDIEPTQSVNPETDQASITLRDQALVLLKKANPNLKISYTLPVTVLGLDAIGRNVLTSAKKDGLMINTLNVMAMDFGQGNDDGGNMSQAVVSAAMNAESNLISAGFPQATIGVTPMIGENDPQLITPATTTKPAVYYTEYFYWGDAQTLLDFAQGAGSSYISRLGMWSMNRDFACPANTPTTPDAPTTCSNLPQDPYTYSNELGQF